MITSHERLSARTGQSEPSAGVNGHALPLKQPIRAQTLSGVMRGRGQT